MKEKFLFIRSSLPWLLSLLAVDGLAALLLWIADASAFLTTAGAFVLATIFLFLIVCLFAARQEQKQKQAFLDFLEHPDTWHEEQLLRSVPPGQRDAIHLLGLLLREKQASCAALSTRLNDYEEYAESWAHETKTPLSLLTLLLDNHGEEFPGAMHLKLDYVRNRLQESVEQMLFYARLKGGRADYMFEHLSLRSCTDDVLEDYRPLLSEKQFDVQCAFPDHMVYSDRRGLRFLLGQIVSNAVKYSAASPTLRFEIHREADIDVLSIQDNGIGVRSYDLPYIFEKGFTGDSGENRKKATGMGLYLAKGIARELNLTLNAASEWGCGFEMRIGFPVVKK